MPNKTIGHTCPQCNTKMEWRPIANMWVCFQCRVKLDSKSTVTMWIYEAFQAANEKQSKE